jgi:hypothetical protein
MSIVVCIRKPMPTPSTAMKSASWVFVVNTSSCASSTMPTVMPMPPMIGKSRYFPVLVMAWPTMTETIIVAIIIGRSSSPLLVADEP